MNLINVEQYKQRIAELETELRRGVDATPAIEALDNFIAKHGTSAQLVSYREALVMVRRAHLAKEAVEADIVKLEGRRDAAHAELATVERECAEKIATARAAAEVQVAEAEALRAEAKAKVEEARGAEQRLKSAKAELDALLSGIKG